MMELSGCDSLILSECINNGTSVSDDLKKPENIPAHPGFRDMQHKFTISWACMGKNTFTVH
jgi:hypothetical protein